MIDIKEKKARKAEKFLFDVNRFDDEYIEEVEEEEPPPPVFSEDELAAAKEAAFAQGKQQGLNEANASRETHISGVLDKIAKEFETLYAAEQLRAAQYEAESVSLCYVVFKKLFPILNEKHGLDEIMAIIKNVLESQRAQQEIIIDVHTDDVESIEKRLEPLGQELQNNCKISVRASETLGPGDCKMSWNDGGASRNVSNLSEEIQRKLEHMLADKPSLQDNRVEDEKNSDNLENKDAEENKDGDNQ